MDMVTPFQNLDEAVCILHCINTFGKSKDSITFPSDIRK